MLAVLVHYLDVFFGGGGGGGFRGDFFTGQRLIQLYEALFSIRQ